MELKTIQCTKASIEELIAVERRAGNFRSKLLICMELIVNVVL